jgi:hypothetical protein
MYRHYNTLAHSKSIDLAHITGISKDLFSEYDILALNDLLLSNGLHTVKVKDFVIGQKVIEMFLTLLNYYQQVYWLSLQDKKCLSGFQNLYKELEQYGCFNNASKELYEYYFYDAFHGDCLIIEHSQQIESEVWYKDLTDVLSQSYICQRMPIVLMLPVK